MTPLPTGLAIRAVAYFGVRDLMPLYAVYALLLADQGLSTAAISSLFVIWTVVAFVAEVPSGAWADVVSRRLLLALSAALYALAFTTWIAWPVYAGFAIGFVLWGVSGALMSGTFEALLYDEMAARDATEHYARVLGWANAVSLLAYLVASLAAAPLLRAGGYALVGWCSVAVALVHGALALTLPAAPKVAVADEDAEIVPTAGGPVARYVAMLRAGVGEAARRGPLRRALIGGSLFIGLLAIDEYFPLLAREHDVATVDVPLAMALIAGGQVVGTMLAGRVERWTGRGIRAWAVGGALAIMLGGLVARPWGLLGVAVGYGVATNVLVVWQARLQAVITGPARATVTSVSGLLSESSALLTVAVIGVASHRLSVGALLAALAVPLTALALMARLWLPEILPEQDAQAASAPQA